MAPQPAVAQAHDRHPGRKGDVGTVQCHLDNGAIHDPNVLIDGLERINGLIERQQVFGHGPTRWRNMTILGPVANPGKGGSG